jgi:TonB-dependent starch-binding outer membrane protein SusC
LIVLLLVGWTGLEAQTRTITGTVVRAGGGSPIAGAEVVVEGTSTFAVTRDDGTFAVQAAAGEVRLRISMLGFRRTTITVGAGVSSTRVEMEMDVLQMEQIVVTGQATGVARRNLANAVATVTAEEITAVPPTTLEQGLMGRIAGANIQSNSGAPGGGYQVRLRGVSTILGGATPLYVVDGIIVSDVAIPSGQHVITRSSANPVVGGRQDNAQNRIADLNPNDIESIEVLKGASASAIYGSKANNGVIVITTKRGRVGRPQFDVSQRVGVSRASNTLGSRNFETLEEAVRRFGPRAADFWQQGVTYDNERALAGGTPVSYEVSASVRGGTETTRYYGSILTRHEGGIIQNTFFDRNALTLNVDQVVGSRVSFGIRTQVLQTKAGRGLTNNDNTQRSFYMTLPRTPNFIDLRQRPDGTWPVNPFSNSNPLQTAALLRNEEDVNRVISGANIDINAFQSENQDLRILLNGGVDFFNQKNRLISPAELQFEQREGLPGTSLLGTAQSMNVTMNANAVHTLRDRDRGIVATSSLGIQWEDRDLDFYTIIARQLLAGLTNIDRGTAVEVRQSRQRVKDFGLFAQEELLIRDRLLLTFGIRGDMSSNNSDTQAMYFFPKGSGSYVFEDLGGLVDEVKIRAALGFSGNQPLYGYKFSEYVGGNVSGLPTVEAGLQTAADDIRPERQREIEGGADILGFGGRATLELTVYEKLIQDLLLQRTLAPSSGFSTQIFNGGELRTRGFEAALTAVPVLEANSRWTVRGTFSLDRNELISLPVPRFTTGGFGFLYGSYVAEEGKSLTQILGNVTLEDGSRIIGPIGNGNPDFLYGFSSDYQRGPVSVSALLSGQQGGTLVNLTKFLYDLARNTADCNERVGDETICDQRNRLFPSNANTYSEDGSFLKLREVRVGYEVPRAIAQGIWSQVGSVRVNLSGRNLLTFTGYTGLDPEVSNFGTQAVARGFDVAPYPPSRSLWLSVDISF